MRQAALTFVSLLALVLVLRPARAERPPEKKEDATHVVTGVIKQITTKESKFGGDGVQTDYTAEIAIRAAEKGKGLKPGDVVKVHWFHVTKSPSKPLPGAYGHAYAVKTGDTVRVYLMDRKAGHEVIYDKEGMVTIAK